MTIQKWREATPAEQEKHFRSLIEAECKRSFPEAFITGKDPNETLLDFRMKILSDQIDTALNEEEVVYMFVSEMRMAVLNNARIANYIRSKLKNEL